MHTNCKQAHQKMSLMSHSHLSLPVLSLWLVKGMTTLAAWLVCPTCLLS